MRDILIAKLSELTMKENSLKRCLDYKFYNKEKRTEIFDELKKTKKEIEQVKFELKLEREMRKNEKHRESI